MARRRLLHLLVTALTMSAIACSGGTQDTLDERVTAPPARSETSTAPGSAGGTDSSLLETTGSTTGSSGSTTASGEAVTSTTAGTSSTAAATTSSSAAVSTTVALDPATPPTVDAASYVVFDMRAGKRLAAANADQRLPVGSLIKLLTTQVAYNAGQPTKVVTAPAERLLVDPDESRIGISAGQELPRDLLIRAMLKASANDAARLLAIDIAGSEAAFAALMNATAADMGLTNTRAVNVTGLDAEGQYSSAADLTTLGVRLMGNITFQQTVKDPTAELNGQAVPNTNDLLTIYPGADGIKTGRTSGAGWCILASATRENRRIVVAVLGAPDEEARNEAAIALLDWGFRQP